MDEARFVFEFVDRGGNPRAPGSSAPQSGGQGSDTAGKYWDSQGQAGGAGGLAYENSQRFGRNHPGVPTPASVPPTQAAKPSDTSDKSLSDTFTEIGGIGKQVVSAVSGVPSGPTDLFGRGKALADAANRATTLAERLFPGKPAQAMAVPPVDARVRDIDVMSPTAKAKTVADDIFAKAKEAAAKRGSAGDVDPADAARKAAKDFAKDASKQRTIVAEVVEDAAKAGGAVRAGAGAVGAAGRAGAAAGASGAAGAGGAGAASAAGLGTAATAAGPIAMFAALAAAIPTALAIGVNRAGTYADQAANRLGNYSGDVARAQAMAEVRQIQADLRTSERLGSSIATRIQEQSALSSQVQELRDKLAKPFIDLGNDITTFSEFIARKVNEATDGTAEKAYNGVFDFYTGGMIRKYLADAIRDARQEDSLNYFDWFHAQPHIAPEGMAFDPNVNVPGARFDIAPPALAS